MIGRTLLAVMALIASAIVPCPGLAGQTTKIPWKIDEPTAHRLASEAYYATDADVRYFDYDPGLGRPFFVYYGVSAPPAEGAFGYFAVNPWTGDVWNLWGCHRLSTPILRKSQAEIRRRFTRDELAQYDRLRRLKPDCIVEN
jgi:hypothetical protein